MRSKISSKWSFGPIRRRRKPIWRLSVSFCSALMLASGMADAQAQMNQPESVGGISQLQQQVITSQTDSASNRQTATERVQSVILRTITGMQSSNVLFDDMSQTNADQLESDAVGAVSSNWSKSLEGENGELAVYELLPPGMPSIDDFFRPKGGNPIRITITEGGDGAEGCLINIYVASIPNFSGSATPLNSGNGADCSSVNNGDYDPQITAAISDAVVEDLKAETPPSASSP